MPLLTDGGVVLIDDYHNYDDVRRAVDDSDDLLPGDHRRAGHMWLGHRERLPDSVERLLSIP